MALSGMSSREKTIVAVLAIIIVLALVGIGILAAQLITGDSEDDVAPIVVVSATSSTQAMTTAESTRLAATAAAGGEGAEMTPVAPPALEELGDVPPPVAAGQMVTVAESASLGPLAPAMIVNQNLYANHRYRIEIRAADGSQVAIQGSWSQAATSQSGQVAAPQIEFFGGVTPYNITVEPPVTDPAMWGCSVSASLKEPLGKTTNLVITIWDVTGVE